jgi:hypothetical protein
MQSNLLAQLTPVQSEEGLSRQKEMANGAAVNTMWQRGANAQHSMDGSIDISAIAFHV